MTAVKCPRLLNAFPYCQLVSFFHTLVVRLVKKVCLAELEYRCLSKWKKRPERRKHCALAVVRWSQKISPRRRPLPGARDGQNLISWRWSLPLSTNPVWWWSMHAISSYRGNRPTNTQTNPQTGQITIHCAAASLAHSVNTFEEQWRMQTSLLDVFSTVTTCRWDKYSAKYKLLALRLIQVKVLLFFCYHTQCDNSYAKLLNKASLKCFFRFLYTAKFQQYTSV